MICLNKITSCTHLFQYDLFKSGSLSLRQTLQSILIPNAQPFITCEGMLRRGMRMCCSLRKQAEHKVTVYGSHFSFLLNWVSNKSVHFLCKLVAVSGSYQINPAKEGH